MKNLTFYVMFVSNCCAGWLGLGHTQPPGFFFRLWLHPASWMCSWRIYDSRVDPPLKEKMRKRPAPARLELSYPIHYVYIYISLNEPNLRIHWTHYRILIRAMMLTVVNWSNIFYTANISLIDWSLEAV